MANSGFSISIRALDEVTSVAEKIKRELKTVADSQQKETKAGAVFFEQVSRRVKGAGRGLEEIGKKAKETGRHLTEAFKPITELAGLGGIAAVGSLAGITAGLERYATVGERLGHTSKLLGLNVKGLQIFQQGARLAGASAETLTSGLGTLGSKLHDAAWGRNVEAIGVFRQLNIAVLDSNNHVRSAIDVLPELADKVKGTTDAYTRMEIATKTLGSAAAGMMPYLLEGRAGIARYNEEIKRYHAVMSPAAIENSLEFGRAQARVGLALDGVGVSIAEKILPVLTPMMNDFAKWIADSPAVQQAIKGVGDEIGMFGEWVKEIDWVKAGDGANNLAKSFVSIGTALGTVLDVMKWMEAHPDIAGLVFGAYVGSKAGPYGAIVGGVMGTYAGARLGQGPTPRGVGVIPPVGSPGAGVAPPGGGMPGAWATAPTGHATTAAPNDARNNWGSLAAHGGGWQSFDTPEAGVQAVRNNLLKNYQGLTLRQLISKWAPPSGNNTQLLIDRAAKMMQMDPDAVPSFSNPEVMRQLVTTMIANEHGGVLPRDLAQGSIDKSLGFGGAAGGGFWQGLSKLFGAHGANAAPMPGFGGAYGVRGAVMNFGMNGGVGAPGTNLVQISTPSGKKFTVNAAAAPAFAGFVADLEKSGYGINSIGGYNDRNKLVGGLSEHAYGLAVDINPGANPYDPSGNVKTNLPKNIHDMAAKYGLIWGGDWKSPADPMHFQWGGSKPWLSNPGQGDAPPVSISGSGRSGVGAGDSSHHVEVNFANAPAGMRASVDGSGNAGFTLRTQHAMGP
ncbi:MAG TPA: M15 family metallopeptidase [Tepidisphaeraceae bacterium]|nr:M15 family metallopeptidase [Tepidisphaeraceae bacterium]